jgi:hypothetical protein
MVVALAAPATAETSSASAEQWRSSEKSMVEFVEDGYELVSVVAPSNQTRFYFLRKPGKVVKCREEAALDGPLPTIPPSALALPAGQQTALLTTPGADMPRMRVDITCAELVHPER